MLAATSKFLRQIIPPVIATLIAAVLIAGFNRAFSTHLTQPRLGGLNSPTSAEAPDERVMPQPAAAVRPTWTAEAIDEPAPVREWQKGGAREAAKDPAGTRTAETPPAAPPAPVVTRKEARAAESRQAEPRQVESRQVESRQVESRQVATRQTQMVATPVTAPPPPVVMAPPVVHGPPPIMMAPPVAAPVAVAAPVIVAAPMRQDLPRQDLPRQDLPRDEMVAAEPPMVTVPDRTRPQPQPQYADQQPAPPQGPIGAIANTLNPSTWFARAREFGEKIEAVGNEILPNIRQ
jgi:hypothetical protein